VWRLCPFNTEKPESEVDMVAFPNPGPILSFLTELSQNNNKTWFTLHRPEYDAARTAFEQMTNEVIDEFRQSDHLEGLSAKDCISRIYRDIRFSKDKSPYKTNMAALIGRGGWRATLSGYYLSLAPQGQSMVAGGLYDPTPAQLNQFRQAIDMDAETYKKVTAAKDFVEVFGGVEGELLKTTPKGYEKTHPEISILKLKQIMVVHHYSDQEVQASDFLDQVVAACWAMKPFLKYLNEIIK
jgi:uncharacterized protein (TIGR02453 family)